MAPRNLKKRSRAAQEDVELWLGRIETFKNAWSEQEEEREVFRRAVRLDLGGLAGKYGKDGSSEPQLRMQFPHRIHQWWQSEAYDEFPEIRYPRDAEGDETYGPVVERTVSRILDDADAVRAGRRALTKLVTDGVSCICYGLPDEPLMPDVEEIGRASCRERV